MIVCLICARGPPRSLVLASWLEIGAVLEKTTSTNKRTRTEARRNTRTHESAKQEHQANEVELIFIALLFCSGERTGRQASEQTGERAPTRAARQCRGALVLAERARPLQTHSSMRPSGGRRLVGRLEPAALPLPPWRDRAKLAGQAVWPAEQETSYDFQSLSLS